VLDREQNIGYPAGRAQIAGSPLKFRRLVVRHPSERDV
jgi:hypothetical protein